VLQVVSVDELGRGIRAFGKGSSSDLLKGGSVEEVPSSS